MQQFSIDMPDQAWTWLTSLLFGLLVLYLTHFYWKVFRCPRGPLPWPVLGNFHYLCKLRHQNRLRNPLLSLIQLKQTYGPVFTLWFGHRPAVIICDHWLVKEAYQNSNDLMGRTSKYLQSVITQNKGFDILFTDHGPVWSSLRRVAHAAVRKYSVSDRLAILVNETVAETVEIIKSKEGFDKSFDPVDYIETIVVNVMASSVFGKRRLSINDNEFLKFKSLFQKIRENLEVLAMLDGLPTLVRPFFYFASKRASKNMIEITEVIRSKYLNHLDNYQPGQINDFTDAVISAKEEATLKDKESAVYLTDHNLLMVLFDLFFAGIDTTQLTLRWIMLMMAHHQDMQSQMRQEVESLIGNRMPVQDDRLKCQFINAFIFECLRDKVIVPLSVPHVAMKDTQIGKHRIPRQSMVFAFAWCIHHDAEFWRQPEQFQPERFLLNNGTALKAFLPFGVGRRVCLGEKLAVNDLFLIVANLLQKTTGSRFVLTDSAGLEPDLDSLTFCKPRPFRVALKRYSN